MKKFCVLFLIIQISSSLAKELNKPLDLTLVNSYACVSRSGVSNEDGTTFFAATKLYYFYERGYRPPAITVPGDFLFCRDILLYPGEDQIYYPRLDLIENVFALWDKNDRRFSISNDNGKLVVNNIIQKRLKKEYGIITKINLFSKLLWSHFPDFPDISGINRPAVSKLGFKMEPFINNRTGLSYCPTQEQYQSNVPLFQILNELVAIDTEGLYMAISDPEKSIDPDGNVIPLPTRYLLIKENLLKKIWFYFYYDGTSYRPVAPDDTTVAQNEIRFYWPADINNPLIKKSNQVTFLVRHPSQLNGSYPTSVIPHDRKFACIPASI